MKTFFIRTLLLLSVAAAGSAHGASLSASPPLVKLGSTVTATWDAIPAPTSGAWMALYNNPAAADNGYVSWANTTGTASGSMPYTIPTWATPGTYHLRMFHNGWTKVATSNTFKVGWTVTGTVTLSGSPLAGVAFSASNGGTCETSNASGAYTCIVPAGWSGAVIPSSTTYGFVPASRSYSNVTSAKTAQNFTAAPLQSYISGVVTASGAPLPGAALSATLGAVCTSSDASGQYTCGMLDGWSGTITPSLAGYVFDPQSRAYSNVTAAQPAQDYLAVVSHNISGTVTNAGAALPGVALAASSGGACSASDSSGQYTCVVPTGWSGTVTPSLTAYAFTPASRAYSGVTTDQTAQDYVGVEFFQLSGTISASGSPLAGVSLTATGGTCTQTNASGQYTCSVAEGSSGTVIPSASGYLFVPAARSYGNLSAPQAGNDFAGTVVGTSAPIRYIHADHLNTPRLVANAAGQTVWLWHQAEPFGNSIPDENPDGLGTFDLPLRFPGQRYDAETGLHYNYFRDYDTSLGRYVESDPIGLDGGLNTYAYVGSDPLQGVDPLGLAKFCCRPVRFGFGSNHCYIIADDGNTYSLYPQTIRGRETGVPRRNHPRDKERSDCLDCPKPQCVDQNSCLFQAHNSYPWGTYSRLSGPNSNTYAATLANKCCDGGVPAGVRSAPGIGASPPADRGVRR